jgi:hypothetical protein
VGCFGESVRPSVFELAPPPNLGDVFLVVSGGLSDDDGLMWCDVREVLVWVSLS